MDRACLEQSCSRLGPSCLWGKAQITYCAIFALCQRLWRCPDDVHQVADPSEGNYPGRWQNEQEKSLYSRVIGSSKRTDRKELSCANSFIFEGDLFFTGIALVSPNSSLCTGGASNLYYKSLKCCCQFYTGDVLPHPISHARHYSQMNTKQRWLLYNVQWPCDATRGHCQGHSVLHFATIQRSIAMQHACSTLLQSTVNPAQIVRQC